MKLRYQETGGFAGLIKSAEAALDELDPREAEAVDAAVTASRRNATQQCVSNMPDVEIEQLYLVHDDGHSEPLLSGTDETDPVLRQLINRLRQRARYERA